ncbi:MAG: potassium transporter TrkG [Myxococcota bacterium]
MAWSLFSSEQSALNNKPILHRLTQRVHLNPSQTLAFSFIALIAVGTGLLMLPLSTTNGQGASWLDALFTMTSVVSTTGLMTVSVKQHYSQFGHVVILCAAQAGGLGIMVLSTAFAVLVGGHLPMRQQARLEEILDVTTAQGLKQLVLAVVTVTFICESIGALALFVLWSDQFATLQECIWWSLFHAVSAFCNIGVCLWDDSLQGWVNDPWVCGVFAVLIRIGSIGFFVIADLIRPDTWQMIRPQSIWQRLHPQTKVVLIAMSLLDLLATAIFWLFENGGVLASLSPESQWQASVFQAVTMRSAGFSSVDLQHLSTPAVLFCCVWMFVGSAPGSAGGGIKVTTAAVALLAIRALLRGRKEPELFGRRLSATLVNRSLAVIFMGISFVMLALILLTATQPFALPAILFETVSACGTVGLSMGITPQLDSFGRLLLVLLMFIGRIGPLTAALAVGQSNKQPTYQYPSAQIAVG